MDSDTAQLQALLNQECAALQQLSNVLAEERDALSGRDVAHIERVTTEKSALLDEVERHALARQTWAQEHGLTAGENAFSRHVRQTAHSEGLPELDERWRDLQLALRLVHRENLVNGRIIARSRQTLSQMLNLLRGQVGNPQLYGPGGSTRSDADGGEIARA